MLFQHPHNLPFLSNVIKLLTMGIIGRHSEIDFVVVFHWTRPRRPRGSFISHVQKDSNAREVRVLWTEWWCSLHAGEVG